MATYTSKTWTNFEAEYPTRYKIHHADASVEQVTMEEDFGTVSVQGDHFMASTFNDFESRINEGFQSVETVTSGTTTPTGGKNGDLYFQTETVNNVTSIIAMFVNVSGIWLEVAVGGASLPQAEGSGF